MRRWVDAVDRSGAVLRRFGARHPVGAAAFVVSAAAASGVPFVAGCVAHPRRSVALTGLVGVVAVVNGPVKSVVRRSRPDEGWFDGSSRWRRRHSTSSFPSGHTATAFYTAAVVAGVTPRWAQPLVWGSAGLIGMSRVLLGAHHPTDVAVGAFTGTVTGLLVNHLTERHTRSHDTVNRVMTGCGS